MKKPKRQPDKYRNTIFEWFFYPLLKFCPPTKTFGEFLEDDIFHFSTRTIELYKASKVFKMPGLYRINMGKAIQGIGPRRVARNNRMWIRMDHTLPDQVEIEAYIGKGRKEHHFLLTFREFLSLTPFLKPVVSPSYPMVRKPRRENK